MMFINLQPPAFTVCHTISGVPCCSRQFIRSARQGLIELIFRFRDRLCKAYGQAIVKLFISSTLLSKCCKNCCKIFLYDSIIFFKERFTVNSISLLMVIPIY